MGHFDEISGTDNRHRRRQQLTRLGILVAALTCLASVALLHMMRFKQRYADEIGVIIPRSANPLLPQPVQDMIESPHYDKALEKFRKISKDAVEAGTARDDWRGAFIAAEAADDFDSQLRIVRAITSAGWPNGECDRVADDCLKPNSNISAQNSFYLSEFLHQYFLDQAEDDHRRGRVARAYDRIDRLRKILYLIDTPLINDGALGTKCCSGLDPAHIAGTFLSQKKSWRDMNYVQSVFVYAKSREVGWGGKVSPELLLYARGVDQLDGDCPVRASVTFSRLAKAATSRPLRELAAYMALRASYSSKARLQGTAEVGCPGGSDEESTSPFPDEQWLAEQIALPGFKSDLIEMQTVTARASDVGAGD